MTAAGAKRTSQRSALRPAKNIQTTARRHLRLCRWPRPPQSRWRTRGAWHNSRVSARRSMGPRKTLPGAARISPAVPLPPSNPRSSHSGREPQVRCGGNRPYRRTRALLKWIRPKARPAPPKTRTPFRSWLSELGCSLLNRCPAGPRTGLPVPAPLPKTNQPDRRIRRTLKHPAARTPNCSATGHRGGRTRPYRGVHWVPPAKRMTHETLRNGMPAHLPSLQRLHRPSLRTLRAIGATMPLGNRWT